MTKRKRPGVEVGGVEPPESAGRAGPWGRALQLAVLVAVTLLQLWLLLPGARMAAVPLNDDAFHLAAVAAAREALRTAPLTALDRWLPYWSLGYPLWHAYQPLPHLATALAAAPWPESRLPGLYAAVQLLLLLAWPWCLWLGARWLGLSRAAATAAAALAPLVATPGLYGLEYGSYLWRGSGLFTQLWAMPLLPLALGRGAAALRGEKGPAGAGALLAATALCHTLYGYVGAASLVLLALLEARAGGWRPVARRLAGIAGSSLLLSAFFVVPMLLDRATIHHSRWEAAWKWDSFGHEAVLGHLVRSELFDAGRWPLVTLAVLAGLLLAVARPADRALRAAAAGFLLWLALFCGRPTWGWLLALVAIPGDFHLHRLVGAVHLFGLLVAGGALGAAVDAARRLRRRWVLPLVALLLAAALLPAAAERRRFVREGNRWARESERGIAAAAAELERVRARLEELAGDAPARVYPGLAAGWGREHRIGSVPAYAFLSRWRLDALAFLYHAMSETSDLMVLFDEARPDHHRLFGVGAVWAEAGRQLPPFLEPLDRIGRFALYRAPGEGRVGIGRLAFRLDARGEGLHEQLAAWLRSPLPAAGDFGWIAPGRAASGLPAVARWQPLPPAGSGPAAGRLVRQAREGDDWVAEVEIPEVPGDRSAALVFLRETWHPRWRVEVDGRTVEALRVTPGFVGARVPPGRHLVAFRYRPGPLKPLLLLLGPGLLAGAVLVARRRGRGGDEPAAVPPATEEPTPAVAAAGATRTELRTPLGAALRGAAAAALALALLLGALPLLQGRLLSGHDSTEYPPRLVEFHRNVAAGHLAPVWAPDLGNGHGQPLFLFSPPLFLWVATAPYALGFRIAPSLAFAALVFYLLGALGAYRAGREAWRTRAAGLLAAAAFALSSHVLLDLYVRGNFNEAAAVALLPWVAAGALRALRRPRPRHALPLALAVAGVALSHLGLLLLALGWVSLLAAGWAAVRRRWRPLAAVATGLLTGLGLAAFFLLPAWAHLPDSKADLLKSDFLAYERHFVAPSQLLASPWGYGLSVPGPEDGMSFAVGWPHLALALAGLALLALRRRRGGRERILAAIVSLATLAFALGTTALAAPAWGLVGPLHYLAYPWRLLAPVSLGLALGAGALLARPLAIRPAARRAVLLAAAVALALWAHPRARPERFLAFDDEFYAPERIASQGITTTTREEYEPRWVQRRPPPAARPAEVLVGRAGVERTGGDPWDRRFSIAAETSAEVALSLFHFPGWRVQLGGRELASRPHPVDGRIVVEVPPGRHELRVVLTDTSARRWGKGLSGAALAVALLLAWRGRRGGAWGRGRGGGLAGRSGATP
ncbi:MAG: YfhO family protein [Thermoanaerobaculia bacterium]|nr:YfhO family protein [Thermoanaerobaculia bacterium]